VDNAGNPESSTNPANRQTYTFDSGNPIPGGTGLEFSSSTYQASEAGATALITVRRNGDATQAVSVDYSVSDGTAVADQDYTAVSGTLNWAANDSTAKTFLVPIKGDNTSDPSETVLLSLQNASSNTTLGNVNTATLTIEDAVCNGVLSANITVDTVITEPCVLVTRDITIGVRAPGTSALLTVSPGVTLIFQSSTGFNVQETGALSAKGTLTKPIIFTDEFRSPGSWKGVQFTFNSSDRNELDNVTIEYGGQGRNGNANLILFGAGTKSKVKIRNSTLAHSSRYGFDFNGNSIVAEFSNNTIINNVQSGVLSANSVSALDAVSRYSGNDLDIVEVTGTAFDTALNPVTTKT